MKRWKEIQIFLSDNRELCKKAALPLVVILAVGCFWIFGNGTDDGIVVSSGQAVSEDGETAESAPSEDLPDEDALNEPEIIYVDLGGEVSQPGVYAVSSGTRLFQVIEQAGGLLDSADTDHINQAEAVADGQKIIIGSKDENSPYYTGSLDEAAAGTGNFGSTDHVAAGGQTGQNAVIETEKGSIVNINLADENQLQLIPGVGPSTARKILEYRESNGSFSSIEDIKNISGIGDKTFENLKDFIIV